MRVALLQTTTGIDPSASAVAITDAVREAKAGGADMVFTPEMSGLLDRDRARAARRIVAEDADPVLAATRAAAAEHRLWVHLGSLALRGDAPDDGRFVNRGFLIGPDGAIRARYAKLHLFDVALPDGTEWRESAGYAPGRAAVAADTPWGRLGMTICYDLRFPALFGALAQAGATLFSVPAAFTVPTGRAHWHVLLRARAIELGAFVIAAAQTGLHEDGRTTFGHSLVVDPWGTVLLDMGEAAGLEFCDLPLDDVAAVRGRMPTLQHQRSIGPVTIAP